MAASSSMINTEPSEANSSLPAAIRPTAVSGIDRLPQHGKFHRERRTSAGPAVHANLPGVFLNDAVGNGKSQPSTTAVASLRRGLVLGCEKWIVDAVNMFLRDTRARVGNDDLHVVAVIGADHQRATRWHGVFRVEKQVQKHLLQLARVAVDGWQPRLQVRLHLDARGLELVIEQRQRVLDHAVQIDVSKFGARGAREVQQTVDNLGGAEGLARDLLQQRRLLLIPMHLLGEHLRITRDDCQWRVDLMRDARRQQTNGRKLLRLGKLRLQLDPLGDIVHDDQAADDAEVFRDQRRYGDVGYPRVAGGSAQPEFVQVVNAWGLAHTVVLLQKCGR